MRTDPAQFTIVEAGAAIRRGDLKPSELIEACLARTEMAEREVRAWAHLAPDQPRMAARLLDLVTPAGSLHGIPFGIKDIIETADMPTGYGTPIYLGHRPARDAACVALLKEAGAVAFGKAVTTELAHFHPGKTHNPHAVDRTPGGSSSGSAAAVAACMVPFALGTQTTGSVLRPASYCGVYGFKPSFGDVSRSGVFECVTSFDTIGWFARSVSDIEIVRRALLRAEPQDLPSPEVARVRIGVFRGPDWQRAEVYTRSSIEGAAAKLASAGMQVEEVQAPPAWHDIAVHHRTIAGYEFARAISWERTERGRMLSPKLLNGRCEDGLRTTYEEYAEASAALVAARADYARMMESFDALMLPAAAGEAWSGLGATGDPLFNTALTALHVPALSIPAFVGPSGLPVGLQIVGNYRRDRDLLGVADSISNVLGIGTVRGANRGAA